MRNPSDECLLCKINVANKTNSHILPRFISTDFLGAKGAPKKGFLLNGENELRVKPKTTQDSPKESYILCDECEAYFSLLETASAPSLKLWQAKVASGHFKMITINPYLKVVQLNAPDPIIMRLIVYSLFWRATISSLEAFEDYKLDSALTESIRKNLLEFKALTNADLNASTKIKKVALHPYSIMTAESFKEETANVLAAINPRNPASLHIDKFGFFIYKSEKDLLHSFAVDFSNSKVGDNQLMVISKQLWENIMVRPPLKMAIAQAKMNLSNQK